MSKHLVKQEMAPAGGYAPIPWKRLRHARKYPLSYVFCTWAACAGYCLYKFRCLQLEQRINNWHHREMQMRIKPFLYSEEDRLKVRARKQHEYDVGLIVGPNSDWDIHRRTFQNDDIWVDYSRREMLPLLTDEERIALGGEPSHYSFNDMWQEHQRNKAWYEDWDIFHGKNTTFSLE